MVPKASAVADVYAAIVSSATGLTFLGTIRLTTGRQTCRRSSQAPAGSRFHRGGYTVARDIWQTLLEAARDNKAVQVALDPRDEIKRPKRPRGRPPALRTSRWSNYLGYDPRDQGRPRCAQPGCRRWLRKDQKVACKEQEREVLAAHAEMCERLK
jgi:hypothetical protein